MLIQTQASNLCFNENQFTLNTFNQSRVTLSTDVFTNIYVTLSLLLLSIEKFLGSNHLISTILQVSAKFLQYYADKYHRS